MVIQGHLSYILFTNKCRLLPTLAERLRQSIEGWHCRWPWQTFECHCRYCRLKRFKGLCLTNRALYKAYQILRGKFNFWNL